MKIHPLANIFPTMADADYQALKADIDKHGLREPVWTYQGSLIDGRHRWRACEELGGGCKTREFRGDESELLAFVISLNLKRRHLDESQRAMVAARLSVIGEKDGVPPIGGLSQESAATLMNVGVRSVERAAKVLNEGAVALTDAVERGEVSVSAAAAVTDLPKSEQRKLVAQGKVKEAAAAKREKPAKPDEVETLREELKAKESDLAELGSQMQPLQDEVEFLRKIEDEGDKLKAACAEVKRLQVVVRGQEERIRGLMNEKAEAVKEAKSAKARVAKLEKELGRVAA